METASLEQRLANAAGSRDARWRTRLQGDVREHLAMLDGVGPTPSKCGQSKSSMTSTARHARGESTTIAYLLTTSGLRPVLAKLLDDGLPVFGTCAGLILLAHEILDGRSDQWSFDVLPLAVRRNGYGRQIASFESTSRSRASARCRACSSGPEDRTWSDDWRWSRGTITVTVSTRPGATGQRLGCSFHPELTSDDRVHRLFVDAI